MNIKKLRARIRDYINKTEDIPLLLTIARLINIKWKDLLEEMKENE